ncbi:hypothetical protein AAII07_20265 [Microvirga sp. 0TCS3.31]
MLLHQTSVVEWPPELASLLEGAQIASGEDGRQVCRIDVDATTLRPIHEFGAHLRRCQVQLRFAGSNECMRGKMNPPIGLGAPSERIGHTAKVRVSFHDLQSSECVDVADID